MSEQAKILLVEDEESLAISLEFNLQEEGYAVTWVKDGRRALEQIDDANFDLIILDIMLPYVDGFTVAARIREQDSRIPVLFLTARTTTKDRIKGLKAGADDYLTKPFHLEELLLRVQGMLKRKAWYKDENKELPVYHFGNNEVNFKNLLCKAGDKKIRLTSHEALLLRYLIDNKGQVVSRKELLEKVWNISSEIETRTVDNFIARLRKYFEADPDNPVFIKSVRGVGYIFE